mmetsp:Transcript_11345/g.32210  ORF Transcript_11345/g.32210 Transcript_11345/m.32210 type:complete len:285 (-) Transcript_11345:139-993(-)
MLAYESCRKIAFNQFPFPWTQMLLVFLICYSLAEPVMLVAHISSLWLVVILNLLSVSTYWTINEVARDLEDPFLHDPNDFPLQHFQYAFNQRTVIQTRAPPCPVLSLPSGLNAHPVPFSLGTVSLAPASLGATQTPEIKPLSSQPEEIKVSMASYNGEGDSGSQNQCTQLFPFPVAEDHEPDADQPETDQSETELVSRGEHPLFSGNAENPSFSEGPLELCLGAHPISMQSSRESIPTPTAALAREEGSASSFPVFPFPVAEEDRPEEQRGHSAPTAASSPKPM